MIIQKRLQSYTKIPIFANLIVPLCPMNDNILEQLNDVQRQAVEYCDGAQLVIAGAGSGKTRVLTYKIAYLLEHDYEPWNILALTFTNKAAREMKERIGRLVGEERARFLNMGTFHSVFAHILRREAEHIGYTPNFTIYDQSDSRSLVKTIIKEMQLDDKLYKASAVADRISMAKNHLLLPQAYAVDNVCVASDAERKMPMVKDIYQRYWERCHQANAMDFDDLLVNTYMLFANDEETRRRYVERFKYVLVDEYQDTNRAQQAIVLQLTRERQKICVVGDDAQSIYSFRGANIDNILNFTQHYTDARLFKLEQNYRSTQNIVLAANSLIKHNRHQIEKDVYSKNERGDKLLLKPTYSDKEEAVVVCADIARIKRQECCEYSDFAILYRTNSQSRSFEECMRKKNIPYRIYGGLSFYQRKEIKDVIAYLRLVANPNDEEALRRIINYPTRGIGDTTVAKIGDSAVSHGVSLWSVVCDPVAHGLDVTKGVINKLAAFTTMVDGWCERLTTDDAYLLGRDIIRESGVSADIYKGREPEDISRQENLEELLSGMQDFVEGRREEDLGDHVSISDYLQEVSLLSELDSDGDADEPKVTLMTIHSAKGLEFPTVFIVGMEENIFPSPMCVDSPRGIEEERRLLYVAITRAERHCILTCAQNRFRYGRMESDRPSRFLNEISPEFISTEYGNRKEDCLFDSQAYGSSYGEPSYGHGRIRDDKPEWQQNPRPVASQFRADPKPRIILSRQAERPVDPFSDSFKRNLEAAKQGRVLRPLNSAGSRTPSDRPASASSSSLFGSSHSVSSASAGSLSIGNMIEHSRFGRGTVVAIEGTGENTKATIDFVNVGKKQLLLKFAKFNVVG